MPVVMDFSPLGRLADTFFDAQDKALKRRLQQSELEAPGEIAKLQAVALGGTPAAPQSTMSLGSLGQTAAQPKMPTFAALDGGDPSNTTAGLLRKFEGYRDKPYWDVNAYRVGYGSDTITDPTTGQARKVQPGDVIDRSVAEADLARRIPEFQATIARQVPTFAQLPENVKAGLTSVAYNYGSLPKSVVAAVNTGDATQIANAVAALPANPDRRRQEAAVIAGAADVPAPGAQNAQYVIPGQAATATPAIPSLQIPAQVQSALQSANPYVRKWAVDQVQKFQDLQRQMQMKVFEHGLDQGNKDRTYNLEERKFTYEQNKPVTVSPNASLVRPGTGEVTYTAPAAPTGDMTEYDLYVQQATAAGQKPEDFTTWNRANKKAGATLIDNTQKGDDAFSRTLGEAQAKRWNGYIESADEAQVKMADIQQMREASRRIGSQGTSADGKLLFGPYLESVGINVEGLPDLQLYDSLVKRLAPNMRATGSGSTSDIEYKGFVAAIGPLSNNPAAREMILDTFEAASRNDLARGDIATRLATGEIDRRQAEIELRKLPDPLTAFREFRKANPDLVGQAIKEGRTSGAQTPPPQKAPTPPQVGTVQQGFRFKGGDPANPASWEKVQ